MTPVNTHFYNNWAWKKGCAAGSTIEKPASLMTEVLKRKASVELSQPIKKAKIDKLPPLIQAIRDRDYEKFRNLIRAGADVNAVDATSRTVLDWIKQLRPNNYKNLVALVKTSKLKSRYKERLYRKYLAHVWNFRGNSLLKNGSEESYIPLEGGSGANWLRIIHKNLNQFCVLFPGLFENANTFKEALDFCIKIRSNNKILARIQEGGPTFFIKYINEPVHEVIVLIWKNQLVLANCGFASRRPLEIYHFNPRLLNAQLLKVMRRIERTVEQYRFLFFDLLPTVLKFFQTDLDVLLEGEGKHLTMQKVDNCSWVSLMAGCYAFFLLSEEHVEIFRNWIGFQQIASLEKIISLIAISCYEPDHALIQKALSEACSQCLHPILLDELNKLRHAYLETFPLEERIELWLRLTFFQNPSCAHLLSPKYDVH